MAPPLNRQDFTIRFRYDEPSNSYIMFAAGHYLGTVMQGTTLLALIKYGCEFGYNALKAMMEKGAPEGSEHNRDLEAESIAVKTFIATKIIRTYNHRGKPIKITLSDLEDLLDESDFEFEGAK